MNETPRVTVLLDAIRRGQSAARDELFAAVYDELRRLAHTRMRHESPGHTLQTTALVNEVYLRLVGSGTQSWENRAHFFGTAAEAMRRILIDRARRRRAIRHGGGLARVPLEEGLAAEDASPDLIELDAALSRLEARDARKATVVKYLYFLGFTVDETAVLTGVSPRTVDRDWRFARAWLRRQMGIGRGTEDAP